MGGWGGRQRGETRPHPHVGSSTETVYKEVIMWLTYFQVLHVCISGLPLSAEFLTLIHRSAFTLQSTEASTLISDSFSVHTSPVRLFSADRTNFSVLVIKAAVTRFSDASPQVSQLYHAATSLEAQ